MRQGCGYSKAIIYTRPTASAASLPDEAIVVARVYRYIHGCEFADRARRPAVLRHKPHNRQADCRRAKSQRRA
jgi:hypothetical protein